MVARIQVDQARLAEFCRNRHVRRLAFFGSILREDFGPQSDIDVLVEFEPGSVPGLIRLGEMAEELSMMMGGRQVDLLTPEDLSDYFRDEVMAGAQVQYAK